MSVSEHLIRKHSEEETVKKIMSMPLKSIEEIDARILLRRKENWVLSRGKI